MTTTQIAVLVVGTLALAFCIYQFISGKKQEKKEKEEAAKIAESEAEEKE